DHENSPRRTLSSRRGLSRRGYQLFTFLFRGRACRALSLRRGWQRDACEPARGHGSLLARLSAAGKAGAAVRLSRVWALEAAGRTSLQSEQVAARPLCEGDTWPRAVGRCAVSVCDRRRLERDEYVRQRAVHAEVRGTQSLLRLEWRTSHLFALARG